jgi:DNA-binding transcriptional ArsR family regulator
MHATFAALAEPTRLRVVELLSDGPRAVGDIGKKLRLRQPQVSKHLRVLSEAGLVVGRVDAQRRIYSLRTQPLQALDEWLATYRRHWEQSFQSLDGVLAELVAEENQRKRARPRRHRTHRRSRS